MSWIDRLRGKPKYPPLSPREQKIEKIRRKVEDEDFEVQEFIGDEALAESAEARSDMGEDLEYPVEEARSLDSELDQEWLA